MYRLLLRRALLLRLCRVAAAASSVEASAAAEAIMVKLLPPSSASASALEEALSSRGLDGNEDCDDDCDVLLLPVVLRCFFDLDFAMAAMLR